MLQFPEEYFRAEEREGFFISETMKRYWACCMDMVRIVDEVCKKNNIRYFASWGTLLGAVRHKGYIPWDDDMDISLLRPDFEKLLEVLPAELPEGFRLSTPLTNENHRQFFCGLSNGIEINLSKEHLATVYNCPFVATIDIFPIDYLPRNPEEAERVKSLFITIWQAVQKIKEEKSAEEIEAAVKKVEEIFEVKIDREKPMRAQLWVIANNLVKQYGDEDADELVQWCSHINWNYRVDKEVYKDAIYVPFEHMEMSVPARMEEAVEKMYGANWRTPMRGTARHEYPAFNKQLDFLRRKVAELKAAEATKDAGKV